MYRRLSILAPFQNIAEFAGSVQINQPVKTKDNPGLA